LFYFDSETISVALAAGGLCVLRATTEKKLSAFLRKKVHPGDLARGCSDLKMTCLLCCACAATATVSDSLCCVIILDLLCCHMFSPRYSSADFLMSLNFSTLYL